LYDEVEFHGVARQDGSVADINAVWFSHWYLENLNALYSGPLDYTLWRTLNDKSFIASRLYEFLFFKFYGDREFLRFNYPTLVQFIPVRTERFLSHARKQMQPSSLASIFKLLGCPCQQHFESVTNARCGPGQCARGWSRDWRGS